MFLSKTLYPYCLALVSTKEDLLRMPERMHSSIHRKTLQCIEGMEIMIYPDQTVTAGTCHGFQISYFISQVYKSKQHKVHKNINQQNSMAVIDNPLYTDT